ncbi:hypothetical protein RB195_016479 [Necator americanus]|uniref:Uncharacterized protein n=1 Tax=Necator americanus TaxID=51031 RepID=A0ABR1C3V4_NECAM
MKGAVGTELGPSQTAAMGGVSKEDTADLVSTEDKEVTEKVLRSKRFLQMKPTSNRQKLKFGGVRSRIPSLRKELELLCSEQCFQREKPAKPAARAADL